MMMWDGRRKDVQFARLADYFEQLEHTTSRKALVEILAHLLGEADDAEIDKIVYLCQGRLVPFFEPLEIGMGEKLVAEAIANAYGCPRGEVLQRYGKLGDLGLVAQELAAGGERRREKAADLTVAEVYRCLWQIATTSGGGSVERKLRLCSELLQHLDALSAKHVVRIPLGRLRLGIGDPTVLDALSFAKVGSTALRKALEAAYNQTSDLGQVAKIFWQGGREGIEEVHVQVGKPIRPALAERLPSPEAIIAKLGRCAVEYKYDGFRCQIHKNGDEVQVYSRNLENMSAMFPEVVQGVLAQVRAEQAILEGEAVSYNPSSEEFYPFQETTKRRRKYQVDAMAESLPLRVFLFDLLYVDGEDITALPYTARRERLRRIVAEDGVLSVSEYWTVDDKNKLLLHLHDAIAKGLEGLMTKKLDAVYQAGARNFNWVKLKRNSSGELQDTVDCVILGYIYGRGKRSSFGAGALLAGVYDEEKDEFVTITKIGTGLSDEEWREIRRRCDEITLAEKPARVSATLVPSVWVEPKVVIEVLADEITRSPVHTAGRQNDEPGYALRFPRLVRFREDDKQPEQATTVREIVRMYEMQGKKNGNGRGPKRDGQDKDEG